MQVVAFSNEQTARLADLQRRHTEFKNVGNAGASEFGEGLTESQSEQDELHKYFRKCKKAKMVESVSNTSETLGGYFAQQELFSKNTDIMFEELGAKGFRLAEVSETMENFPSICEELGHKSGKLGGEIKLTEDRRRELAEMAAKEATRVEELGSIPKLLDQMRGFRLKEDGRIEDIAADVAAAQEVCLLLCLLLSSCLL